MHTNIKISKNVEFCKKKDSNYVVPQAIFPIDPTTSMSSLSLPPKKNQQEQKLIYKTNFGIPCLPGIVLIFSKIHN